MKIIYIPIENYNRELVGKLFLSLKIISTNKKFAIVLGEKNFLRALFMSAPSGLIIEKGMRKNMIQSLRSYKKKNHKVFLSDEEAITYLNDEFYFKRNIDDSLTNYVNFFLATSKRHKKTLLKKIDKKKISIVGNLKYDISPEYYKKLYKEKIKAIKKKYNNFILVNSRFGNVNKNSVHSSIFDKKYYNNSNKIFKFFLKLPLKLKKKESEQVVIRPHPSENIDFWKKKYEKKKNIHVIYEDNVFPWILGSSKVIHNRCTTSLDSFFLNQKTVSFEPLKENFEHKAFFDTLSKRKNTLSKRQKKLIQHYIQNIFSRNAAKTILKLIQKIYLEECSFLNFKLFILKIRLFTIYYNLRNYIKFNKDYSEYVRQKVGKNSIKNTSDIFNDLKILMKFNKNINLEHISQKIFMIKIK